MNNKRALSLDAAWKNVDLGENINPTLVDKVPENLDQYDIEIGVSGNRQAIAFIPKQKLD